ncbi:uncharacterized protein N7459_007503 [Penicillium hispanicum]|uniref:uncharacterized protein n=1 Tax=Penicillium hispanicum TaxID=1080232 RepID=UPI00254183A8|nr:uncharacterized protein N7459_007503 [Penicillium hispanicum]KAJ5578539.1 hypothetical protein N7459_007503 [Penicillium hispanicum]
MLSTLPPDNWTKEGRVVLHRLDSSLTSPRPRAMSNKDGTLRKRESRSGTRKVSSLSAEQLERKRANDREAQRSIHQRTKEHIEQLENQVSLLQTQLAEMRPRSDRFDEMYRRNASLEDEVRHLKQQLSSFTGRPGFASSGEQVSPYRSGGWHLEDGAASAASGIPTPSAMLSPHFSGPSHRPASVPRALSAVSPSSQTSHPQDWQQYPNPRSPSLGESSDAEFGARMDSYVIDGQLHQGPRLVPPTLPVAGPPLSFSNTTSPSQATSESSFSQVYHTQGPPSDGIHSPGQPSIDQSGAQFLSSHRSLPVAMPSVSAAQPMPVHAYSSGPLYQDLSPQREQSYPYQWVTQT